MRFSKVLERRVWRRMVGYRRRILAIYRFCRKHRSFDEQFFPSSMPLFERSFRVWETTFAILSAIIAFFLPSGLTVAYHKFFTFACIFTSSEVFPIIMTLMACLFSMNGIRDALNLRLAMIIRSTKKLRQIRILNDSMQWVGMILFLAGAILKQVTPLSGLSWLMRPASSVILSFMVFGAVAGLLAAFLLSYLTENFSGYMIKKRNEEVSRLQ